MRNHSGVQLRLHTVGDWARRCAARYREPAFSPDGGYIHYADDTCQHWLVSIQNPAQRTTLRQFPEWWLNRVYPQWGFPTDVTVEINFEALRE